MSRSLRSTSVFTFFSHWASQDGYLIFGAAWACQVITIRTLHSYSATGPVTQQVIRTRSGDSYEYCYQVALDSGFKACYGQLP